MPSSSRWRPRSRRGGDAGLKSKGLWRDAMRQTLRKPSALIGVVLLLLLVLMALLAPLLAPYGPREDFLSDGRAPTERAVLHLFGCDDGTQQHILGIDGNGRDEFCRGSCTAPGSRCCRASAPSPSPS